MFGFFYRRAIVDSRKSGLIENCWMISIGFNNEHLNRHRENHVKCSSRQCETHQRSTQYGEGARFVNSMHFHTVG